MLARPSPSPSTPMVAQVPGMNCISPCAPLELVRLLRPWAVSAIPIPATSAQGILYSSAAATYSFLILGGIGSGGLFRESRRGARGRGSGKPTPPSRTSPRILSEAGDVPSLDGATACPSRGRSEEHTSEL